MRASETIYDLLLPFFLHHHSQVGIGDLDSSGIEGVLDTLEELTLDGPALFGGYGQHQADRYR